MPTKKLVAHQKTALKKQANQVITMNIGKNGLTDALQKHLLEYLEKHELVKLRVNRNSDQTPQEVALNLANSLQCTVLRIVGSVITLYKEAIHLAEEQKQINLA